MSMMKSAVGSWQLAVGSWQLAVGRRPPPSTVAWVGVSCLLHTANCQLMKIARTEAIVLHTVPVRERDKMVVFLTPDHGKRKAWAYGARAIRSRFGAALEPLAKIRIGY